MIRPLAQVHAAGLPPALIALTAGAVGAALLAALPVQLAGTSA